MGFGTQWRDLLDDMCDALRARGFRSCKLTPGGHEIPVVNDCLVYVWRVPKHLDAVSEFASSPTRKNGFTTPPLDPVLWEPSLAEEQEATDDGPVEGELGPVLNAVENSMPLVLVMVESAPRQLQSIEWAVAILDGEGNVGLRGREAIWVPEPVADGNASGIASFDSGVPVSPKVEPRVKEGPGPDA
ncbi:hypothetical protein [Pseudonocardia sp. GCM10023141]|uniref:hypothetical protein n=1 Tax=Pseudonocardia sp. GCM10023141 TaxID=3252653 RepID=UPI003621FA96